MGYQFYLYKRDAVFRARANSPTPSPEIWWFLAGYGLVLVWAALGAALAARPNERQGSSDRDYSKLLIIVWAVVGFVIPYIPVGQQRKLVMGLQIPLCILCAVAVTEALRVLRERCAGRSRARAWVTAAYAAFLVCRGSRPR